ncbi:hypothetical protein MRB53_041844 [Persea americana]|nr:hypothetical protein MRB53_041844 [Persea americana]
MPSADILPYHLSIPQGTSTTSSPVCLARDGRPSSRCRAGNKAFPSTRNSTTHIDGVRLPLHPCPVPCPDCVAAPLLARLAGIDPRVPRQHRPLDGPGSSRRMQRGRIPPRHPFHAWLRPVQRPRRDGMGLPPHRESAGRAHGPALATAIAGSRTAAIEGATITSSLAHTPPPGLKGVHFSAVCIDRPPHLPEATTDADIADERRAEALEKRFPGPGAGLSSPSAYAAGRRSPTPDDDVFSPDAILDEVTLYWLTNMGGSSARKYWERQEDVNVSIIVPVAITQARGTDVYCPRRWAEVYYRNVVWWSEPQGGGKHWLAWEAPGVFVNEVRGGFWGG